MSVIPIHKPVMSEEVLRHLVPSCRNVCIIDATLGEGGHASMFLEAYPESKVVGIDADPIMVERASMRLSSYSPDRFEGRVGWNDDVLADWKGPAPGIVLVDLGVSYYHYKKRGKGFAFTSSEPLDMRLDDSAEVSASDLVNKLGEDDLANLIFKYGEERYSRRIARRIVARRQQKKIVESSDLANIVYSAVPSNYRYGRLHPATKTFQALRIAVNHELDRLARILDMVPGMLASKGKLGVISFHSLEDRMVKQTFRSRDVKYGGDCTVYTKKPVVPSESECLENPSSRSAKFRVLGRPEVGGSQ